jgi:hypothetical protein
MAEVVGEVGDSGRVGQAVGAKPLMAELEIAKNGLVMRQQRVRGGERGREQSQPPALEQLAQLGAGPRMPFPEELEEEQTLDAVDALRISPQRLENQGEDRLDSSGEVFL